MRFAIGARVNRIEDREVTGATVVAADGSDDETNYLIAYDEGGEGWWPQDALDAMPPGD